MLHTRPNEFLFMAACAADATRCHFYDNISRRLILLLLLLSPVLFSRSESAKSHIQGCVLTENEMAAPSAF